MPRVSKKLLDKDIESQMYKQFWNSLAKIDNPETAYQFFSDLLTETEKVMLAKRFATSILLIRGKSATDIRKSIHLSYTTIGSVAAWVKNANPKTRELLKSLSKEKDWGKIIDRIEEILDRLPPKYGSDWKGVRKTKWKRTSQRTAKEALR